MIASKRQPFPTHIMIRLQPLTRSKLYILTLGLTFITPIIRAASTLFEGGTVISFDESFQTPVVLQNMSLLVTDDRIAAIFDSDSQGDVVIPGDTERISAEGKILSPGFIDTHRHGWQTAFKTIASNTTLTEYAFRYGEDSPVESNFIPDDMYFGQIVGMWESLNAGVTTVLDHAHGTFSNETSTAYFKGSVDSGARVFWCYAIHDIPNGYSISDQMANFQELAHMNSDISNSTVEMGIAYDGFSTASMEELQSVMEFTRRPHRTSNISALTTHYLGGPWISSNSPQLLNTLNFLNTSFPIVFSHGSFLTTNDALLLRQFNQYLSITPESEMHYGHTHPHSALVQDQAALGVDTHFTYSADMVTQARLWLQSTRLKYYGQVIDQNWKIPSNNPMSVNQAFLLITRSGALSLRRPDLGVLTVGAKADIVVFDGNSPNLLGWSDAVAAIILHSNVGDIEQVMVDGQWRKRDGKLVAKENVNRDEANQQFLKSARRIQGIWKDMALPVLGEDSQTGVPFGMALVQDVVRGNGTGY
ncbi:hypothetical protein D9758_008192 [Tetrapyrgos nigripes]|uniref:Amidohydrolase-related domain-containing protein n=1 Tax=Tetrapyrgos nigripes TaxID=182062 RepID=A0A8H5LPT1_9AGAR|nr:hypothetical protein D9758_008192 [Tetrapyrgos nigripes]